jgi:hypothetical protein
MPGTGASFSLDRGRPASFRKIGLIARVFRFGSEHVRRTQPKPCSFPAPPQIKPEQHRLAEFQPSHAARRAFKAAKSQISGPRENLAASPNPIRSK